MKRILILLLTASIAASFALPAGAQQNPFLSTDQEYKPAKATQGGVFYNSTFMQKIRKAQKSFQAEISDYISRYQTTGDKTVLSVFLLFSFLYGLLHVLGPGHRKVFLFTYFVARPSKWKTGMIAGFMTAVLHAVSAVVFIGGLYLVTSKALMSRFNDVTPMVERISYGAIILIGAYLLVRLVIEQLRKGKDEAAGRNPDTLLFVLASGLIPCPGAATIMIFSLAVGAPAAGVYAVAAMSLGMGSVLTLIPPAAGLIRNRLNPLLTRLRPGTGESVHTFFSAAGSVLLILFGLFFII